MPKNKTNMKHIILLLLLGVCSSAFAQKKIIGKWYLIELFGERNPVEMYRLQRTTKATAGYLIKFGIMDKIQAILEMIASNGQNSGCFFV